MEKKVNSKVGISKIKNIQKQSKIYLNDTRKTRKIESAEAPKFINQEIKHEEVPEEIRRDTKEKDEDVSLNLNLEPELAGRKLDVAEDVGRVRLLELLDKGGDVHLVLILLEVEEDVDEQVIPLELRLLTLRHWRQLEESGARRC